MGEVKQININNQPYYFYNDMINLKNFEPNLLKINKKHYKEINIYYIGYIMIKKSDDYESIYSVNPFYLKVNCTSGYIEEKNGDDSVDENKEVLRNMQMFGMELKTKSKQKITMKKIIMKKITWKLNLILTITCH